MRGAAAADQWDRGAGVYQLAVLHVGAVAQAQQVALVAGFVAQAELGTPESDEALSLFVLLVIVTLCETRLASHIRKRAYGHG